MTAAALGLSRRTAVVALVLIVLCTLGGAAPAAPRLSQVFTVPGSVVPAAFTLGPTALFTAIGDSSRNGRSELRRHALSRDSPQWTVQAAQNVGGLFLVEAAHVLIASSRDGPDIAFLDADTGRALWRSSAGNVHFIAITDTGVLSITSADDSADLPFGTNARLRMADLRSGRTIWSRNVSSIGYLSAGEPATASPSRAVFVTTAGRGTVLDLADGSEVGNADLGVRLAAPASDERGDLTELTMIEDRLYVLRRVAGSTSISAYSGDDLRVRWRVTGVPFGALLSCGVVLCIKSENTITALDQRDGSLRWTDTTRSADFASNASSARHLVLITSHEEVELRVLDAVSGRLRQRLGTGRSVGGLILRSDPAAPDRSWVTVADADGTYHTAGAIEIVSASECSAVGRHLACPGAGGMPSVWRVR